MAWTGGAEGQRVNDRLEHPPARVRAWTVRTVRTVSINSKYTHHQFLPSLIGYPVFLGARVKVVPNGSISKKLGRVKCRHTALCDCLSALLFRKGISVPREIGGEKLVAQCQAARTGRQLGTRSCAMRTLRHTANRGWRCPKRMAQRGAMRTLRHTATEDVAVRRRLRSVARCGR